MSHPKLTLPPARSRSSSKTAGFTLLELMIAVAIIGIIAALATPSFQEMLAHKRAVSDIELVRDELLQLRGRSRAENMCLTVTVSTGTTGISLSHTEMTNCQSKQLYYAIAEGAATFASAPASPLAGTAAATATVEVGKYVSVAAPETVMFDPLGGIFAENPVEIAVLRRDTGAVVKTLRIIPGTGVVRTVSP